MVQPSASSFSARVYVPRSFRSEARGGRVIGRDLIYACTPKCVIRDLGIVGRAATPSLRAFGAQAPCCCRENQFTESALPAYSPHQPLSTKPGQAQMSAIR